jgi:hypothetical protein
VAALPAPSLVIPQAQPGYDYRTKQGDPRKKYVIANVPTTYPRAVALIYGYQVVPQMVEVVLNAHGVGDTATLNVPIAGNPEWSSILKKPTNADGAVVVEIYAGFNATAAPGSTDTTGMTRIFVGIVSDYDMEAVADMTVFECLSLAVLLQVDKQTTLVAGMTTVQFLQQACTAAGIGFRIKLRSGQTALPLAAALAEDFVVGIHNMKAWDLIAASAVADDCDVWVDRNGILWYYAPELEGRSSYTIDYNDKLIDFKGKHSPQFAKNIHLEGRLWNDHTRTSHVVSYITDGNGAASMTENTKVTTITPRFGTKDSTSSTVGSNGQRTVTTTQNSGGLFKTGMTTIPRANSAEHEVLHFHDITPEQVNQRVQNEYMRRSRFEYTATLDMPLYPDLLPLLDVGLVFQVTGCPFSAFNSSATTATPDQVASAGASSSSAFASSAPYYFQRRTTIRIEVGDGEEAGAGATLSSEMVNHAISSGSPI